MLFKDFTEKNYRRLISLGKNKWRFIDITEYKKDGNLCFWRHDVDLSLKRAYRICLIESEENVSSTYFLNLHSRFYNLLESDSLKLVFKIIDCGHQIGLHFDMKYFTNFSRNNQTLSSVIKKEKKYLEDILGIKLYGISFHNPDDIVLKNESDVVCGMVNTYGPYFRKNYIYCSDSNGYWRHKHLEDVLSTNQLKKIHILTHPGWWTPTALSPDKRVKRCINGRAKDVYQQYLNTLKLYKRENIGKGYEHFDHG